MLTVRPDGSATLVETTRAEGVAALALLRAAPYPRRTVEAPVGEALPETTTDSTDLGGAGRMLGEGVRLTQVADAVEPGAATRTKTYAVADVSELYYVFGRGDALDGISSAALAAAFNPTGGTPRGPSPEWIAEATYTFSHADGELTVHVPRHAVGTRDVWRPDLESHTVVSAGTAALRFTVRAERSGATARLVHVRADSVLATLPPAWDWAARASDGRATEPAPPDYQAARAADDARRRAFDALADSAVGGIDRPGLFLAPAGPIPLPL